LKEKDGSIISAIKKMRASDGSAIVKSPPLDKKNQNKNVRTYSIADSFAKARAKEITNLNRKPIPPNPENHSQSEIPSEKIQSDKPMYEREAESSKKNEKKNEKITESEEKE